MQVGLLRLKKLKRCRWAQGPIEAILMGRVAAVFVVVIGGVVLRFREVLKLHALLLLPCLCWLIVLVWLCLVVLVEARVRVVVVEVAVRMVEVVDVSVVVLGLL